MTDDHDKAVIAASLVNEAVTKSLARKFPDGHPMSDEMIRTAWRENGGSFHGASPDFFGTMPEGQLLDYIKRSLAVTSLLIAEITERSADALELSLCENCDGLHIHAMIKGRIKCGMIIGTPEEVDALIDELRQGRREMLKRRAEKT